MKSHEWLYVAGVAIAAVWAANKFLGNITVNTTGATGAKQVV